MSKLILSKICNLFFSIFFVHTLIYFLIISGSSITEQSTKDKRKIFRKKSLSSGTVKASFQSRDSIIFVQMTDSRLKCYCIYILRNIAKYSMIFWTER